MGKVILEVRDLKTKYVTRFREDVYAVDGVSSRSRKGNPSVWQGNPAAANRPSR